MSDCVYIAWAQGARDLDVRPREGSRQLFDLARSLFGEPGGLWGGAAPVVLGLLCRMHGLALSVSCHPWFNKAYYKATAQSDWQKWAVLLWGKRAFWQEVTGSKARGFQPGPGRIYLWLGGHHAYYASEPHTGHLTIMSIQLFKRQEVKQA
jgi:hypothetical protein